jgi:hypothetical protein
MCYCVCFKGWLLVYYGLDLLLSKLSKAQSSGKFCERHSYAAAYWATTHPKWATWHPKNIMSPVYSSFADLSYKINDLQRNPAKYPALANKSAKVYHSLYSSTEQLQVALWTYIFLWGWIKQCKVYSHSTPPTQSPLNINVAATFPPKYHCTKKNLIVSSDKVSSHSENNLQLSRRRGIRGFWPRALCAPIFLGPLTRQMGRCVPPPPIAASLIQPK